MKKLLVNIVRFLFDALSEVRPCVTADTQSQIGCAYCKGCLTAKDGHEQPAK